MQFEIFRNSFFLTWTIFWNQLSLVRRSHNFFAGEFSDEMLLVFRLQAKLVRILEAKWTRPESERRGSKKARKVLPWAIISEDIKSQVKAPVRWRWTKEYWGKRAIRPPIGMTLSVLCTIKLSERKMVKKAGAFLAHYNDSSDRFSDLSPLWRFYMEIFVRCDYKWWTDLQRFLRLIKITILFVEKLFKTL